MENTKPGWYLQPDGSHWWWDGQEWSRHGKNEPPLAPPPPPEKKGGWFWKVIAIVVVTLLFLAMCTALVFRNEKPETSDLIPQTSSTSSSKEEQFKRLVETNTDLNPDISVDFAKSACKHLDEGATVSQILNTIVNSAGREQDVQDYSYVFGAGVVTFCPEHEARVKRELQELSSTPS